MGNGAFLTLFLHQLRYPLQGSSSKLLICEISVLFSEPKSFPVVSPFLCIIKKGFNIHSIVARPQEISLGLNV